ncbi:esterase family protein [Paenibacillaceae bacterium]|nr:esterase family protein [Paenibacillaceae bacterium]
MALINCNFFSDVLGLSTSMTVILPQQTQTQIGMEGKRRAELHPTLYLLHGLSDDHTIWLRRTSIERYVASLGLAVVMPQVHRSFYTDMAYGGKYWTFISEELPAIAQSMFHLSSAREDNFVAGLSMGGYGAFKLALRQPERFAAAASLSGAMDVKLLSERGLMDFQTIFGNDLTVSGDDDLLQLLDRAKQNPAEQSKLFQCCGTEDFLYEDNTNFRDLCIQSGLDLTYEEEPGNHNWDYWDLKIQRVLQWLPLQAGRN